MNHLRYIFVLLIVCTQTSWSQESWFTDPPTWRVELIHQRGAGGLNINAVGFGPNEILQLAYPKMPSSLELEVIRESLLPNQLEAITPETASRVLGLASQVTSGLKSWYPSLRYHAVQESRRAIIVTTPSGRKVCVVDWAEESQFHPEVREFVGLWNDLRQALPKGKAWSVEADSELIRYPNGLTVDGLTLGDSPAKAERLFGGPPTVSRADRDEEYSFLTYPDGHKVLVYQNSVQAVRGYKLTLNGEAVQEGMSRESAEVVLGRKENGAYQNGFVQIKLDKKNRIRWVFAGVNLWSL